MTNQPSATVTLAELTKSSIGGVENYRLTWDNFLLMTNYGQHETWVYLTTGQGLVIHQPLNKVLREFAIQNQYYSRYAVPYYEYLSHTCTIRGLVAGYNILVPSMGSNNPEVVYYMTKPLRDHIYLEQQQGMLLNYDQVKVVIPAYPKKFEKILKHADRVSHCQIKVLREMMRLFGIAEETVAVGNQYYEQEQDTQMVNELQEQIYGYLFNSFHELLYGEKLTAEQLKKLCEVLFLPWKR
ncbi:hypothetical protein [Limosilactobacillus caecicola]|uniref:hypothetical protein n=1 Tax=Limosilactobacillus caecicola TaxID=2941332 RepID=UPI00203A796F|nr:hypothetical protein [Limosilactobacillus caecicola]